MKINPKIHKIKWSWPSTVQRPEIYRDDEVVYTKTVPTTLRAIDFLMRKQKGNYTYTITVFKNGRYITYWRHSMPCLGGLAKYKDSHGEKFYMNAYFPRDIKVMFPEGDIKFIAVQSKQDISNPFFSFLFSKDSPWISGFGEGLSLHEKYILLSDMDTDPTVFYSLIKLNGVASNYVSAEYGGFKDWEPKAQLLARTIKLCDPRRLVHQNPIKISAGTWAQGYGYTRPFNESIFSTNISVPLKKFGAEGGYAYGAYNATNTIALIKKVFKKDIFTKWNTLLPEKQSEAILTKAWDYFKELPRLGNTPGEIYK